MFAGERQDLVSLLSCADLFLLPSAQESFGMAALEAMACEVPVVASRVGGLPEVIDDGETGFLCEPDDLDGMAERGVERPARSRRGTSASRSAGAMAVRTRFCTDGDRAAVRGVLSGGARPLTGPDADESALLQSSNVKVVKKSDFWVCWPRQPVGSGFWPSHGRSDSEAREAGPLHSWPTAVGEPRAAAPIDLQGKGRVTLSQAIGHAQSLHP